MAKFDHLLKGYPRTMKRMIFGYGQPVATISQFHMFGQLALVNNDPRSAGIYTLEDCQFMTFDQETFNLIKKFYSQEFNLRRRFIQEILPIIETFGEERKIQTIQYFEPEIYLRVS
jgi:CRP-like cAMP-binding protein